MQRLMRAAIGTQQHRQLLARLPLPDVVGDAPVARPVGRDRLVRRHRRHAMRRSSSARTRPRAIRSSARGSSRRRCAACSSSRSTRGGSSFRTTAVLHLSPRPGSNAALMLGLAHVVARDGLVDHAFVDARTEGCDAVADLLADYTPRDVERISGVPAADLERAAHIYAEAGEACILWGLGRHRAHVRLGGRAADLQPRADQRQGRAAGLGAAAAARAEQRPGLVGHGRAAGHVHRLPAGDRRGRRAPLRGALGRADDARARAEDPRDVRRRGRRRAEGDVHLRRGRRADRPEHDPRRRRARGARVPRRAGHLRERDLEVRRRDPARLVAFSRRAGRSRTPSGASSSSRPAIDPPGEARTDFDILTTISAALGHEMGFATPADVMDEIAALTPALGRRLARARRPRRAAVAGRRGRHRFADPLQLAVRAARRPRAARRAAVQATGQRVQRGVPARARHRPPPRALQRGHDDPSDGQHRPASRATGSRSTPTTPRGCG